MICQSSVMMEHHAVLTTGSRRVLRQATLRAPSRVENGRCDALRSAPIRRQPARGVAHTCLRIPAGSRAANILRLRLGPLGRPPFRQGPTPPSRTVTPALLIRMRALVLLFDSLDSTNQFAQSAVAVTVYSPAGKPVTLMYWSTMADE